MILLGLLALPFVVGACAYLLTKTTITLKEYALMTVLSALVGFGGYQIAKYGAMQDVEHWNGHITNKRHDSRSCCHCSDVCDSHDEDGNCTSSHEECSHFRDYYWLLDVSTGDELGDSCTHQSTAPGWYTKAYKGEPAAVARHYTNYLKADPESLMTPEAEKYLDQVPPFPEVYGLYHVQRVLSKGVNVPPNWQKDLDEMNKVLGPQYQVDVLLLVTKNKDPMFAKSVEAKWLYGPKNAVTVVIGAPDGKTIDWARVVTLSEVEKLKIEIRDELPGKALDDPKILPFLQHEIKTAYSRTPMAEYEYLATAAKPTTGWTVALYLLNLCLIIGLAVWMHQKDVFGDERWQRFRSGKRRRFGRRW